MARCKMQRAISFSIAGIADIAGIDLMDITAGTGVVQSVSVRGDGGGWT